MTRTREQVIESRRRLKKEYGALFSAVAEVLYKCDPIGICFGDNPDEYEPEAGTILPRLRGCRTSNDALQVVYEEFVRWFDLETAGPLEHYNEVALEIWKLWQQFGRKSARF